MNSIFISSILLLGVVCHANALQVLWQSNSGGTDLRHDGVTSLDGTFQAEVGSFNNGFTPTVMNLDLWQDNWRSFGTTTYNAVSSEIRGAGDLANNNEFIAGEQVYLWVWNQKTGQQAEWLLVRNDSWTWPSVSPLAFSFNIVLSEVRGGDVVFGRANQDSFQIQTRRPFRGVWNYQAWMQSEFTVIEQADESISSRSADPDDDGVSNLFEFSMGTNPKVRNLKGYLNPLILIQGEGGIILQAIQDPLALIEVDVKGSSALINGFVLNLDEQGQIEEWSDRKVYRFTAKSREFFRIELKE